MDQNGTRKIDSNNNNNNDNNKRNFVLEKRIKDIIEDMDKRGINHYGGMGMDCVSKETKALRLEELAYMRKHPDLYEWVK